MDDEAAGDGEGADHAFFIGTVWRGIGISQWNAERHADRAKTILSTSGLVLTVITVGLVGVAEVLGAGLESLAGLDRAFYGILAPLLVVGLFGIFSVLASMVFATAALRSLGADNIVSRANFTGMGDENGEVDDLILDRCAKMSKRDRYAMYRSYIRRLGDLARSNRRMDRHVRLAHMFLLYGLLAISVISTVVIAGMLHFLGTPAQSAACGLARRPQFHVAVPRFCSRGACLPTSDPPLPPAVPRAWK